MRTRYGHNAKTARNTEIKRLFASGIEQPVIGKRFGISQCRVSAIVNDRLPTYSYCNHCGTRIRYGISVCDSCKLSRARSRLLIQLRKLAYIRETRQELKYSRLLRKLFLRPLEKDERRINKNMMRDYRRRRHASVFKKTSDFLEIL